MPGQVAGEAERFAVDASREHLPLHLGKRPVDFDDQWSQSAQDLSQVGWDQHAKERRRVLRELLRIGFGIWSVQPLARPLDQRGTLRDGALRDGSGVGDRGRANVVTTARERHSRGDLSGRAIVVRLAQAELHRRVAQLCGMPLGAVAVRPTQTFSNRFPAVLGQLREQSFERAGSGGRFGFGCAQCRQHHCTAEIGRNPAAFALQEDVMCLQHDAGCPLRSAARRAAPSFTAASISRARSRSRSTKLNRVIFRLAGQALIVRVLYTGETASGLTYPILPAELRSTSARFAAPLRRSHWPRGVNHGRVGVGAKAKLAARSRCTLCFNSARSKRWVAG